MKTFEETKMEWEIVEEFCRQLNAEFGHAITIHANSIERLRKHVFKIEQQAREALKMVEKAKKFIGVNTTIFKVYSQKELIEKIENLFSGNCNEGDKIIAKFPDGRTVIYEFNERWDYSGEKIDFKIVPED